ncbi:ABC transporter ATP-binding protein [Zooshikella sp. RANM57]|uniref:ABC transporter ATP-binding protein n=1 Tax=Zooshikella sp. RANM57 TaxID=3425863 RepID=UPI003D6F642B
MSEATAETAHEAQNTKEETFLLSVQNLCVDFQLPGGVFNAVKGISFNLRHGSTIALVGESGSGKSVTAQAILGILPSNGYISSGQILLQEHPTTAAIDIAQLTRRGPELRTIRGGKISMIFQEPMVSMSAMHTIGNQVSEALFLHRNISRKEGLRLTREMLSLVGFRNSEQAMNLYPFELSGGLRQRAMIAMALICHPVILIADEPTTALDVTVQMQILKLMKRLQQELNMAILLITHDLGVVANMADEVVVMYHGQVVERGPVSNIFLHPQHKYLRSLFTAIPRFGMQPDERLIPIRGIENSVEQVAGSFEPWSEEAKQAGPHLSIKELSKIYVTRKQGWLRRGPKQEIKAVLDFSLDIGVGECVGLVGESGCGKSTISKLVMQAISPTTGQIQYNDRGQITDLRAIQGSQLQQFRTKMQLVFQDPYSALSPRMTIREILSEPFCIHQLGDAKYRENRVKDLMSLVGLDPALLNRYPHSFSGGQRQRISIARALALAPDFLILDEPVSALDVSVQAQILNLLKDLQAQLQLTYLFISHNLAVVDYIADRIAVMCRGQLVEIAPTKDLFYNPQHPYTQALMEAVPVPDLNARLDFEHMVTPLSQPEYWPAPYTLSPHIPNALVEISDQHFVRMCTVSD